MPELKHTLSDRIFYHRKKQNTSMFSRGYSKAAEREPRDAKNVGYAYITQGMLHDDLDPKVKAFRLGHMAYLKDAGLIK